MDGRTYGQTYGWMDGKTDPLVEMQKVYLNSELMFFWFKEKNY